MISEGIEVKRNLDTILYIGTWHKKIRGISFFGIKVEEKSYPKIAKNHMEHMKNGIFVNGLWKILTDDLNTCKRQKDETTQTWIFPRLVKIRNAIDLYVKKSRGLFPLNILLYLWPGNVVLSET